ncbi:MAG TPA: right-handed parallel beta-helix repeat-containing protein [Phycisphaerae bacterium]|nr:right-handed parallel beta-helix repeat-containing protein [Phycisphaerae bacterium]HRW53582.1 right-handed parallel beta-helix repeat-containing protein [Phycisphaerae bacterium]
MTRLSRQGLIVSLTLSVLCAPSFVAAATIHVPADHGTIQGAINAASAGDTILVAPGVYHETILVDEANLEIVSSGGRNATAIVAAPGAGSPIVTIGAAGVTLGRPDQGFRIEHQDAGAASVVVIQGASIGSPAVDAAAPTTIAGNRFVAQGAATGVRCNAAIADVSLNIQGNVFASGGGPFSFATPMRFESTIFGTIGAASFYGATVRIESNVVNDMTDEAVLFVENIHSSDVVIDNNTFNGVGGSGFGFECDRYLEEQSTLSYTNNQVNDLERGFHLNYVDSGGRLDVSGNAINAAAVSSVYVENVSYGGIVTITENVIAGGGATGVRFDDIRDGCVVLINNNEIRDFSGDGVAVLDVYYSIVDVEENTIAGNSAVHGIYHRYSEAAMLDVRFNDVSGFDGFGIDVEDQLENGGVYRFSGNTLEGAGASYGMYFAGYFHFGPNVEIAGNTISGFETYGIYMQGLSEGGGRCVVSDNALTAAPGGVSAYGLYWSDIQDGGGAGEVTGNVINMNGADRDGLYFYFLDDGATLLVDGNSVTGYQRSGLYFDDYIEYGATCLITNNTFQSDLAAGSPHGINISDTLRYGADLVIGGNTIEGFDEYGVEISDLADGASAVVEANLMTARPSPSSGYGVHVGDVDTGSYLWVRDNSIDANNGPEDAIYVHYVGNGSTAEIRRNTCENYRNAGVYIDGDVEQGGALYISENTLRAASAISSAYGVYLAGDVVYGSYLECVGNIISGFREFGLHTRSIYHSDIVCDNNVLSGADAGADYGVYIADEIEYGVFFSSISNNTISGVRDNGGAMAGLYLNQLYEGADLDVYRNTITGHADGASYGFMIDYLEYGSELDFSLNTISGFSEACVFVSDYIDDACVATFRHNDLYGAANGLLFGGEITEGCVVNVRSNNIDGFSDYGVRLNQHIDGSVVDVSQNRVYPGPIIGVGLRTFEPLGQSTRLSIDDNCFRNIAEGVVIFDIHETASVTMRRNDLSDVTGRSIISENADAQHAIDAIDNWFDVLEVAGFVNTTPELSSPPDLDGDGVPNCEDRCPQTASGAPVDEDGCPLPPPPDDNVNDNAGNANDNSDNTNGNTDNANDNVDNGNDNAAPGPQPTPDTCGCGAGSAALMPLFVIGLIRIRHRSRRDLVARR